MLRQQVAIGMQMAPAIFRRWSEEARRTIAPAPHRPTPGEWPDQGIHAAWLGHSTVLLKVDGTVILTDPVFGSRVGLSVGPLTLGMKRLVRPALRIRDLPRPDLILLSHAHMDHFDLPSLEIGSSKDNGYHRFEDRGSPPNE